MSERSSTEDVIRPIITETYGDNGMSRACVVHLAERIERYNDPGDGYAHPRGREHVILRVVWDWFPGGSTAEVVAGKIEAALGGRINA